MLFPGTTLCELSSAFDPIKISKRTIGESHPKSLPLIFRQHHIQFSAHKRSRYPRLFHNSHSISIRPRSFSCGCKFLPSKIGLHTFNEACPMLGGARVSCTAASNSTVVWPETSDVGLNRPHQRCSRQPHGRRLEGVDEMRIITLLPRLVEHRARNTSSYR